MDVGDGQCGVWDINCAPQLRLQVGIFPCCRWGSSAATKVKNIATVSPVRVIRGDQVGAERVG